MKMCYLYKMEFYSVVKKKNEIMKFADKWMELETVMLNEVIQTLKQQAACVLCHSWILFPNHWMGACIS